jgi:hypothetical protein
MPSGMVSLDFSILSGEAGSVARFGLGLTCLVVMPVEVENEYSGKPCAQHKGAGQRLSALFTPVIMK